MPSAFKVALTRQLGKVMRKLMNPDGIPRPVTYVGADSTSQLCTYIGQFGLKKALLVTDKPLCDLGLVQPIVEALQQTGLECAIFDGVQPDPTTHVVCNGLSQLRDEQCDHVIGIGGGSSIDTAKIIAYAAGNNCDPLELVGRNMGKEAPLPLFAVPTTAGTGSEVTVVAVMSDDETHEKNMVVDRRMVPQATALDAKLMAGLPAPITAATGMDALTHAVESYIGMWPSQESDFHALAAVKLIFENLEEACNNGSNLQARENMALASFYAGLAFTKALVGYVHAIAHQLGRLYDTPHGLANAIVLPHVLSFSKPEAAGRLAVLARHIGIEGTNDEQLAQAFIDRVSALNKAIGIPETLDALQESDFDDIAETALAEGQRYPVPRYMDPEDCTAILGKLRS
jgi:alcohol dehydrogenase class IV